VDTGLEVRQPAAPAAPPTVPDRYPWARVVGAFALVAVVATAVVALVQPGRPRGGQLTGPTWLDGWFQFDSGWYLGIASNGYSYHPGQQSSIAFFPVYPMSVRLLGDVAGDRQVAGTAIAVAAGLAFVLLFGRWAWQRLPRRSATLAIAVALLYPYAFFLYGPMYADSLFLLTTISSFLLLERRWYWAAGLVGALATAGRPVGVAVGVGLVVRALELLAQDRRAASAVGALDAGGRRPGPRELLAAVTAVRWRQAGVLMSFAGLAAWMVWLGARFGDPLAWVHVEAAPGWDQGAGPRTWFKIGFAGTLVKGPYDVAGLLVPQALACLAAVLLLRRVYARFGWGYLAYTAVVLLIPILGTKDFMGTGRYVLAAFPALAAAGDWLASHARARPWLVPVVLGTCAGLLLLLTSLYGRSVEVS
jgi:hypothetical protein